MSDEKPQSPANESNEARGPEQEDLREEAKDTEATPEQESLIERARARAAAGAAVDEPEDTAQSDEIDDSAPESSAETPQNEAADGETADEASEEADATDEVNADPLEVASDAGTASETPVVAAAPAAKGGRGLALLSLVLALGAVGGAGYLYYELIHKRPYQARFDAVDERVGALVRSATEEGAAKTQALATELAEDLSGLRGEFQALGGDLEQLSGAFGQLRTEQSTTIDEALAAQQSRLERTEASLIESLNRVANQAPPTQEEWKLAELEYLLRIANHRVLMEKDADGALRLLETADAMLAELDDFGLHAVRAALADEILSLKRLGKNDVQGLFLRLEALKRNLSGLPLDVPEYLKATPAESAAVAEEEAGRRSPVTALAEAMGTFFKIRELRTEIRPLLAPEEVTYLEMNLRLMIEQAQLAALRGQADIFEQSIDNAIDWLNDHLDADAPDVVSIIRELTALREISVVRDMPDISGSLRELIATERGAS